MKGDGKINRKHKEMLLIEFLWLPFVVAIIGWSLTLPLSGTQLFEVCGTVTCKETGELLVGGTVSVDPTVAPVITGGDGSYTIFVSLGAHTLKLVMEGFETHEETITVNNEDLTVNVALIPSGYMPPCEDNCATIAGKVTDARTRYPIPDATVKANGYRAKTGQDGNYTLSVEVGTYTLTVSKEGYQTGTASVDAPEEKTYSVDVSLTRLATIKLRAIPNEIITGAGGKMTVIRASVIRPNGMPAVGITVNFKCSDDVPGEFNSQTAVTDDRGVATVTWTYTGKEKYHYKYVHITASATVAGQSIECKTSVIIGFQCPCCH